MQPLFLCKLDEVIRRYNSKDPYDKIPRLPNCKLNSFKDIYSSIIKSAELFSQWVFVYQSHSDIHSDHSVDGEVNCRRSIFMKHHHPGVLGWNWGFSYCPPEVLDGQGRARSIYSHIFFNHTMLIHTITLPQEGKSGVIILIFGKPYLWWILNPKASNFQSLYILLSPDRQNHISSEGNFLLFFTKGTMVFCKFINNYPTTFYSSVIFTIEIATLFNSHQRPISIYLLVPNLWVLNA